MKIQPHKFLGLNFDTNMQTSIFSIQKKTIDANSTGAENERASSEVHQLLIPQHNKNYLMSAPSVAISQKISVGEEKFDGRMFGGLPTGKKITILINDKLFYRYLITPNAILCVWVTTEPIMHEGVERLYMKYTTFKIHTDSGHLSYPVEKPFEVELFRNFIQYLIFLEFSELETVVLKPNVKFGNRKDGRYFNESREDIVVVDSTWNKIMIKTGEFGVSGHLRFQPSGEGRSQRKLIYIKEYTKSGYTRNASKVVNN